MARTARRVVLTGRVQGVAFRWSTQEKAQSLGLAGWVRNLRDGRVEAWLEAEESDPSLAAMLAWLRRGPRLARVDRAEVFDAEAEGAATFEVRPTGGA